ncbi:hypothetical protein [Streptomyces cyaneochromogenes]|uniref:hypothetical protein n=1 Tax=Streptomyces cyaneochromogenes TaxID=2496836 RepID=UPI00389B146C
MTPNAVPVGEEVMGRTVRHATEGVPADPDEMTTVMLREAQLLVAYRSSPLVALVAADGAVPGNGDAGSSGPRPGDRAPDCHGLTAAVAATPLRLYDLLRDRGHVLVLYADSTEALAGCRESAATVHRPAGDNMTAFVVTRTQSTAHRLGTDRHRRPAPARLPRWCGAVRAALRRRGADRPSHPPGRLPERPAVTADR